MSLAAPVERDGFAYIGDAFYAYTSNRNCHRRASLSHLRDLFQLVRGTAETTKDHPAHWYEAQLVHYGLQPSKTKSVAKLRLSDAFNKAHMSVPQHLQRLETELRKQWNKNMKQAKKDHQGSSSNVAEAAETIDRCPVADKKPEGVKKSKLNNCGIDGSESSSNVARAADDKSYTTELPKQGFLSEVVPACIQQKKVKKTDKAKLPSNVARRSKSSNPRTLFVSRAPIPAAFSTPRATIRRPRQTARRSKPFNPGSRFDARLYPTMTQVREGCKSGAGCEEVIDPDGSFAEADEDDDIAMQDAGWDDRGEDHGGIQYFKRGDRTL